MNLTTWKKRYNVPTNTFLARKCMSYLEAKDWYLNSYYSLCDLVVKISTNTTPNIKLLIDILAATSPRQSVKRNLKCAIDIYIAYQSLDDWKAISCGIATKYIHKNLERLFAGQKLNGKKVRPFAEALSGNTKAVVIDSWMLKAFNINRSAPTPNDREHITTVVNKISDKTGLEPSQVQACLWSYAKTELNDTPFKEASDYSDYIKELI